MNIGAIIGRERERDIHINIYIYVGGCQNYDPSFGYPKY